MKVTSWFMFWFQTPSCIALRFNFTKIDCIFTIIFKTMNNMAPSYMTDMIHFSENKAHNLRSISYKDLVLKDIPRTNCMKNSFTYNGKSIRKNIKNVYCSLEYYLFKSYTRKSWCNASMSPEIHTAVMHNTNIIVVEKTVINWGAYWNTRSGVKWKCIKTCIVLSTKWISFIEI